MSSLNLTVFVVIMIVVRPKRVRGMGRRNAEQKFNNAQCDQTSRFRRESTDFSDSGPHNFEVLFRDGKIYRFSLNFPVLSRTTDNRYHSFWIYHGHAHIANNIIVFLYTDTRHFCEIASKLKKKRNNKLYKLVQTNTR